MTYCPKDNESGETLSASEAGFDRARLDEAIAFAQVHESPWPRDLEKAGDVPGLSQFEKPPWNEALGPFKPRGGTNGILLKGGRIVGRWGDPGRVDMTFSIAKSYIAVLAGIALGDSLIPDIDARVAETVPGDYFASPHNSAITWRHLLSQTSEWEGTLWDKPELSYRRGRSRPAPRGSFWRC